MIADEHRPFVYITAGRMVGTVLLDGFAAAAWRIKGGELAIEPFRKLTKAERRTMEPEAEALRAWLQG